MSEVERSEIGDAPPIRRSILAATLLVLGAPTAFLVALSVRYMLVRPACGSAAARVLLELGTLIVLAFSAGVVLQAWRLMGRALRDVTDEAHHQPRFLFTLALAFGVFCLLSGLALWAPSLFLSPCGRP